MPHKKRKVRKKRGSRTHGYGQVGQHRGGGGRGGHGKAGYDKHKWTYTIKYHPNRFAKHGFKTHIRKEVNVINIGRLEEEIPYLLKNKRAKKAEKEIKINLAELGYGKLLGKGRATHPLIVEVDSASESAKEKILEAGGRVIKPAKQA